MYTEDTPDQNQPLYTEEDTKQTVDTTKGNYGVLRGITTAATGTINEEEEVNYEQHADTSWRETVPENNAIDANIASEAALKGDTTALEISLANVAARNEMASKIAADNIRDVQLKVKELSKQAAENVVAANPAIIINNNKEEVLNSVEQSTSALAAKARLDKLLEDGKKWGTGLLFEFIPPAAEQGPAIDRVAIKYGAPENSITRFTPRSQTVSYLQNVFQSLPEEEKLDWLEGLSADLKDSMFISDWQAAMLVTQVVYNEEQNWGGFSDWADRLGVVGAVASGVFALLKAGSMVKGANAIADATRTVAMGGGKSALVAADVAKVGAAAANMERAKAAGVVLGEATGISAAIDLTKLVSMSAAKILPDALLTGASEVQKTLRAPVEKLIRDLQETVAAKGVKADEAAMQLDELTRVYSPANNPNVHSLDPFTLTADGTAIVGNIVYKPADSSSFLTKEAAEAALKQYDPNNTGAFKVVPDTTNTGFLVKAEVKESLLARKQQLEAQLLTDIENAIPVNAPTTLPIPTSLKTAKPRYKTSTVQFASDVDKAIYQITSKTKPSKSDAEITTWLKRQYKMSDAQIKEAGAAIKEAIKVREVAVGEGNAIDLGAVTSVAQGSGSAPSYAVLRNSKYFDSVENTYQVGNLTISRGLSSTDQKDILNFTSTLGKALGMDGRKIMVLDMSEARNSTNELVKDIVAQVDKHHVSAAAVHFPMRDNASVIVMKKRSYGKGSVSRRQFAEVFAHEYAHAFEKHFEGDKAHVLRSTFLSWVSKKELTGVDRGQFVQFTERVPLEALLEFRAITSAEDLASLLDTWKIADKYGQTGEQQFEMTSKMMGTWSGMYSEFFAEQFAKWAFTDEVPTTILGQYFTGLVKGFKLIVDTVNATLEAAGVSARIGGVEANYRRMLNTHIKMIKQDPNYFPIGWSESDKGSASIRSTTSATQQELASIDQTLSAINAAETGLKTGWLIEGTLSKTLDYSTIGKYTDEDINSAVRFALGDRALEGSLEVYTDRLVGVNQQSRYQKLLTEFVRPSIERLNRSEQVHVTDALVLGDKEGKVFSVTELRGLGLTNRAQTAYFKVRQLRDVMHQMRNETAAKSLIKRGFVQINSDIATDDGVARLFGKVAAPKQNTYVFVPDEGKVVRVSDDFDEQVTSNGWRVYDLIEPVMMGGKPRKTIALKDKAYTTQTIQDVIPYRQGEFRRMYSDEYFVKHVYTTDVDNVATDMVDTLRTARSSSDANAYVSAFNKAVELNKANKLTLAEASKLMEGFGWKPEDLIAELATGKYDTGKLEVRFNRMDDDYVSEMISLSSNFSTSRGDKVMSVYGEDTVNVISPLDSIAAEISNTAYVASVTEWREAHVQKWFNTFVDDLPTDVQRMTPEKAFAEMLNRKGMYAGSNKRLQTAEKTQDYILSQLNIPTKEERTYLGHMRSLSESIEGYTGGSKAGVLTGVALRASKDYPTWARTIAFHSFFAFNPVQFFMQGMNAFNAVAVSPIHGLKSAKSSSLYAMALMSDQEEIWTKFAKANKVTSLGLGMKEDEFVETVRAIRRLGLLDGINTTSLYGAEVGKYGIMNGLTRKVGTLAATPFNAGEGYSRLVSFDIARREYIEANPGVAWWTDDNLATILKRQDDLTQNMTRANTASWQRGWKSIPLQFTQYQTKLMMNVVQSLLGNKRVFTRPEALQLLVTHSLVMGTAGSFLWPFRDLLTEVVPEDLTEEQRLYIQQGVISGMIGSFTEGEAQLALGSRFNTFKYYEDLAKGLLDPEKSFMEVATGPSGFAALRILGGVGETLSIVTKAPMTMSTLQAALTEMGKSSFSALNNIQKTRMALANYNIVTSSSGGAMYRVTDTEAWLMSFGLPPAAQEDLSILYSSTKARNDDLKSAAKTLGYHANLAAIALDKKDQESADTHIAIVQTILNSYEGYEYTQLLNAAHKTEGFVQYEKMLTDQMVKQWTVKDLLVDTGVKE